MINYIDMLARKLHFGKETRDREKFSEERRNIPILPVLLSIFPHNLEYNKDNYLLV